MTQTLSQTIRAAMTQRGWNHIQLAAAMTMLGQPTTHHAVARWLEGTREPRHRYLRALCQALEISADELLGVDQCS